MSFEGMEARREQVSEQGEANLHTKNLHAKIL